MSPQASHVQKGKEWNVTVVCKLLTLCCFIVRPTSVCLSICLSVHPSIYLSIYHLSVHPSTYLLTYLSVCLHLSVYLSVCLYIIYPIYLSVLPYSLPSFCPLIIICLDLYSLTSFCLVLIFLCGGSCWLLLANLSMSTKQFARTGIGISWNM